MNPDIRIAMERIEGLNRGTDPNRPRYYIEQDASGRWHLKRDSREPGALPVSVIIHSDPRRFSEAVRAFEHGYAYCRIDAAVRATDGEWARVRYLTGEPAQEPVPPLAE